MWATAITSVAIWAGYYTNTDHPVMHWLARIGFAPAMPAFFTFWAFGPSVEGLPTGLNVVHIAIATFVLWWIIVEAVQWFRS